MTAHLPSDWAYYRVVPKPLADGDVLVDVEYVDEHGEIAVLGTDMRVGEALELLDVNLCIRPW